MLDTSFIPHNQPSTIVHPRKAPLHLPMVAVTGAESDRPSAQVCRAPLLASDPDMGGSEVSPLRRPLESNEGVVVLC
jgi:hypothetical protein